MDHKSILSIHVIYEYVYMLQASLAGFPLFFISKASYTILLHLFFHIIYFFQRGKKLNNKIQTKHYFSLYKIVFIKKSPKFCTDHKPETETDCFIKLLLPLFYCYGVTVNSDRLSRDPLCIVHCCWEERQKFNRASNFWTAFALESTVLA